MSIYPLSWFAGNLMCRHCGEVNQTKEWPLNGDKVPFYYQKEPGNYNVKVHCPHCNKDWYVVWDDDPGPVMRLKHWLIEKAGKKILKEVER